MKILLRDDTVHDVEYVTLREAKAEIEKGEYAYNKLRQGILGLKNEVCCRLQHGADSNGHLDFVYEWLDELLDQKNPLGTHVANAVHVDHDDFTKWCEGP